MADWKLVDQEEVDEILERSREVCDMIKDVTDARRISILEDAQFLKGFNEAANTIIDTEDKDEAIATVVNALRKKNIDETAIDNINKALQALDDPNAFFDEMDKSQSKYYSKLEAELEAFQKEEAEIGKGANEFKAATAREEESIEEYRQRIQEEKEIFKAGLKNFGRALSGVAENIDKTLPGAARAFRDGALKTGTYILDSGSLWLDSINLKWSREKVENQEKKVAQLQTKLDKYSAKLAHKVEMQRRIYEFRVKRERNILGEHKTFNPLMVHDEKLAPMISNTYKELVSAQQELLDLKQSVILQQINLDQAFIAKDRKIDHEEVSWAEFSDKQKEDLCPALIERIQTRPNKAKHTIEYLEGKASINQALELNKLLQIGGISNTKFDMIINRNLSAEQISLIRQMFVHNIDAGQIWKNDAFLSPTPENLERIKVGMEQVHGMIRDSFQQEKEAFNEDRALLMTLQKNLSVSDEEIVNYQRRKIHDDAINNGAKNVEVTSYTFRVGALPESIEKDVRAKFQQLDGADVTETGNITFTTEDAVIGNAVRDFLDKNDIPFEMEESSKITFSFNHDTQDDER